MLPIVVGAAPYEAAYSRAVHFDAAPALSRWRQETFYPAFASQIQPALQRCFHSPDNVGNVYRLVLSFDASGRPAQVLIKNHAAGLDCFAQAVSAADLPVAPLPDFAEHFELKIAP